MRICPTLLSIEKNLGIRDHDPNNSTHNLGERNTLHCEVQYITAQYYCYIYGKHNRTMQLSETMLPLKVHIM